MQKWIWLMLLSSVVAQAETHLVGTWILDHQECASGAPAHEAETKIDGQYVISSREIVTTVFFTIEGEGERGRRQRCVMHETLAYTLKGDRVHSRLVGSAYQCPMAIEPRKGAETDDLVSISGDTLRITNIDPEYGNETCPDGDKQITVLRRK